LITKFATHGPYVANLVIKANQ